MSEEGDWPVVRFGNPDDPQVAVSLPTSIWQAMLTLLAGLADGYPEGSDDYRNILATISLIEQRTGLKPDWSKIP